MKYLRAYNESFSNESELKEALEIYAEELSFEMDNISIAKVSGLDGDGYKVKYSHVSTTLNSDMDYDTITDEVEDVVTNVFTKFARKYDMIFVRNWFYSNPIKDFNVSSFPTVDLMSSDPNREYDLYIIVEFMLE